MALLTFSKNQIEKKKKDTWKILIVDDEIDIHIITKTVLKEFEFENKNLEFFSAYSGKEAISILKEHSDIVLVLLDVIMESDDAGLEVVRIIREELNNNLIRIILRTGHPGSAPEEEVILKYKINDYKEKTELSSKKLFTCIVAALRSYIDITTIENNKLGLEKVLKANKEISKKRTIQTFIEESLNQLLILIDNDSFSFAKNSFLCLQKTKNKYKILLATNTYKNISDFSLIDEKTQKLLTNIDETTVTQYSNDSYIGYFSFDQSETYILYISDYENISDLDKKLIEIFTNSVYIALNNLLLTKDILDTQKEIIERLGELVETRSQEASQHVHRVAIFSYTLAKDYGLSEIEAQDLKMASPMHDVGKIGIPDSILLKAGKLSEDEFVIMKTHAVLGYKILKNSKKQIIKTAAIVAYEHHEKYDGTGYPRKLQKEEIHIYGRITAIADVFDALYHKRCYKEAWPLEDILALFKKERNKHFDPVLVDIVLNNIDKYVKIIH